MNSTLKLPPLVSGGKFLIGHGLEMMSNDHDLFSRGFKEHGRVFSIKLFDRKAAVLCGEDFNRWFFKETDKSLNIRKPYRFLRPLIGDVLFLAPREQYVNQRPIVKQMLSRDKMPRNLRIIQETTQNWFDQDLGEEGRFEVVGEFATLIQKIVGKAFFGQAFLDEVEDKFWGLYKDIGRAMDPVLPPWLPIPKFIRRDRAKRKMAAMLKPILTERREHPEKYDDFLQELLTLRQKDGTLLTDEFIQQLIIALIFAGHETTAGILSWTVIQLLQNPGFGAATEAEIKEVFPLGRPADARLLMDLDHVRWAVDETIRMRASTELLMRIAEEDIEIEGFQIPKGWLVCLNSQVSHFMPEYFAEPEKYDPYRFGPERQEDREHRHAIMAFGGGTHKCAGMSFAKLEMQLISAMLMQQYELELEDPEVGFDRTLGATRPAPTWIRYKRKPKAEIISEDLRQEAIAGGCPHMRAAMEKAAN